MGVLCVFISFIFKTYSILASVDFKFTEKYPSVAIWRFFLSLCQVLREF